MNAPIAAGAAPSPAEPAGNSGASAPPTILIVDDSRTQRTLLRARLTRWGYRVIEANDGAEALAILRTQWVPLVISDWLMPGMSGLDLCRVLRADPPAQDGRYSYVILLTAKQEKADLSQGLSAGADDFLSKPVDEGELHSRVKAGLRLVEMQERLIDQRARTEAAYQKIKDLYETLDRDLRVASLLQHECLPPEVGGCNGASCTVAYRPAGHVGGDLVGYFPAGPGVIAAFSIDVSGHGVASSLMTVRLAQMLGTADVASNIALTRCRSGDIRLRDPADVIGDLNRQDIGAGHTDLYFTMVLAGIDMASGRGQLCRAGHPRPAIVSPGGRKVRLLGRGGPPVGLLPDATWETERFSMAPGDRLFLYSDGLEEARRPDGRMIDTSGLCRHLRQLASYPMAQFLPRLVAAIEAQTCGEPFDDDVSALLIERPGHRTPQPGSPPANANRAAIDLPSSASSLSGMSGAGVAPAAAAVSSA